MGWKEHTAPIFPPGGTTYKKTEDVRCNYSHSQPMRDAYNSVQMKMFLHKPPSCLAWIEFVPRRVRGRLPVTAHVS